MTSHTMLLQSQQMFIRGPFNSFTFDSVGFSEIVWERCKGRRLGDFDFVTVFLGDNSDGTDPVLQQKKKKEMKHRI